MRNRSFLSVLAVLLVIGFTRASSALEKVTYSDSGVVPSYSVVWVGVGAGMFAKNGLDLTVISAASTAQSIQSMLSGSSQMGNADTVGTLLANDKGADLVTLLNYQRTILFEFWVRDSIKTPEDLKGKKMGISRFGGTSEHMTRLMLRKLGLDPDKDVTLFQVGSGAQRAAALMNNSVQGIVVSPPQPVRLSKNASVRRLTSTTDLGIVYPYFSFVTTRKYLNGHREIFRKFVKGYEDSLHYYATHKDESKKLMGKWLRTTDDEILENIYDTTIHNSYMKPYVPSDVDIIYKFAEADAKRPIKVKWSDTYDNTFLKALDKSGYIDNLFKGVSNVIREVVPHNN